jgi:sugar-specific transcriptional regulator TrmB
MSNFLPLGIRNILTKTQWNENEIVVYSILLEKGVMNISAISHETSLAVSTLQYTIKQLIAKKMIVKILLNNQPSYFVAKPEKLQKWVKGFTKQFQHYETDIENFVDQYDFHPQMKGLNLRLYEGLKGLKQSYKQMLKECHKNEIYTFSSQGEYFQPEIHDFFMKEYIPQLIKQEIHMKNMSMNIQNDQSKKYDALENIERKEVIEESFPVINVEINLYNDCMHYMSFDEKGSYAFIIQDAKYTSIFRALFLFIWKIK